MFHFRRLMFIFSKYKVNGFVLTMTTIAAAFPLAATDFDPAIHEIYDVKVFNGLSSGEYPIYANGRMQAPVYVWVKIKDKQGNNVFLDDTGSENGYSLVYLYDKYLGDNSGSYLDIDDVGGHWYSNYWGVSRTRNKYENVIRNYSIKILGSNFFVSSYPNNDGWNRYIYWVTSTEAMYQKNICARVGSSGNYYFSCSDGRDEYASIKSLLPYHLTESDYNWVWKPESRGSDWGLGRYIMAFYNGKRAYDILWEHSFRSLGDYDAVLHTYSSWDYSNHRIGNSLIYSIKPSLVTSSISLPISYTEAGSRSPRISDEMMNLDRGSTFIDFPLSWGVIYLDEGLKGWGVDGVNSWWDNNGRVAYTLWSNASRGYFKIIDQYGTATRLKLINRNYNSFDKPKVIQ